MKNKKKINWKTIDDQVNNLEFPLVFIYNILKNQKKIDDYDLSLILRYYLKNKTDLSMKYPLYVIMNLLSNKFIITKKVVNEYYTSILKKIILVNRIAKFRSSYNKENFWNKTFYNQKLELERLILIFRSHFDAGFTGLPGASKFISQIKFKNNKYIIDEIKYRLYGCVELLSPNFFEKNNITLIKSDDFDKLTNEQKIKFLLYFYLKTDKVIKNMIHNYDLLNIHDIKIRQIINPRPIYINFNRIYSDNDSEDLELLIE